MTAPEQRTVTVEALRKAVNEIAYHRRLTLPGDLAPAVFGLLATGSRAGLRAWAVHHDHCGYRLNGTGVRAEVALPREWIGPDCTCGLTAALRAPAAEDVERLASWLSDIYGPAVDCLDRSHHNFRADYADWRRDAQTIIELIASTPHPSHTEVKL